MTSGGCGVLDKICDPHCNNPEPQPASNWEPVRRVARSLPFFLWDLAETGRCWERSESDVD